MSTNSLSAIAPMMQGMIRIAIVGVAVLLCWGTTIQADIIIDEFDDEQTFGTTDHALSFGNAGGARDLFSSNSNPGFFGTSSLQVHLGGGDAAILQYDAVGLADTPPSDLNATLPGGPLDFSTGNNFFIDRVNTGAGNVWEITVVDGTGPPDVASGAMGTFPILSDTIPFSLFPNTDFSNVLAVQLKLSRPDTGGINSVGLNVDTFRTDAMTHTLSCGGFEPPLDSGPVSVKRNRVLPLKAELFDTDGIAVTDMEIAALPVIQVMFSSDTAQDPIDVTDDALAAGLGFEGNQFVFTDELKWQYNLKTKNYRARGIYTISIVSGDISEYDIDPSCQAQFVIW